MWPTRESRFPRTRLNNEKKKRENKTTCRTWCSTDIDVYEEQRCCRCNANRTLEIFQMTDAMTYRKIDISLLTKKLRRRRRRRRNQSSTQGTRLPSPRQTRNYGNNRQQTTDSSDVDRDELCVYAYIFTTRSEHGKCHVNSACDYLVRSR